MPTAAPFSWVVRFTVAPVWVQDGFAIDNDRALGMLAQACSSAHVEAELDAQVLEAPSPLQIARMQGYGPQHPQSGRVVRELLAGTPGAGRIRTAMVRARHLLDSVAFVTKEGDTTGVIEQLDAAIALLDTRQGERMPIEA